ncbi:DUF4176 domain-containing protein [Streptococcus gallolyticus]|uniref:DUF4176 domain-containing protein n=1 Tax=Streptococcus gallolyticus TaxID=315405 RepID=UPI003D6E9563
MNEREHLPIGTVVRVNGDSQNLMISTLFPVTEKDGQKGYFDFGAVPLPLGVVSQDLVFFNKEDIEEILFLGYIDVSFQQLIANYDELVTKIQYPQFTVDNFNK